MGGNRGEAGDSWGAGDTGTLTRFLCIHISEAEGLCEHQMKTFVLLVLLLYKKKNITLSVNINH